MAKIIGTHKVKNFTAWLPVYENDDSRRSALGIKTISVVQGALDPNIVAMHWEVEDLDKFEQMLADPNMKDKMEEAGVEGHFDYFILS